VRRLLTVLLFACAAVGWATPARAHNVLIDSDPGDGTTLTAAPRQVTLVFDQPVRKGYAQVGVTGPDGSAWADGVAKVSAERVSVKVKPLPAGRTYVIGYRVLSADGHPVTGSVTFALASGAVSAPAQNTAEDTAQDTAQIPAQAPAQDPTRMPAQDTAQIPARTSGEVTRERGAAAAEAAANGGAGMAVIWLVAALLVLAAGTAVALRRAGEPDRARTEIGP